MMFLYLMCLQESLSSTVKIWPKASRRALLTPYLIMLEHCGTLIKMFLPREMTLSGLNRILADVYFGVSWNVCMKASSEFSLHSGTLPQAVFSCVASPWICLTLTGMFLSLTLYVQSIRDLLTHSCHTWDVSVASCLSVSSQTEWCSSPCSPQLMFLRCQSLGSRRTLYILININFLIPPYRPGSSELFR